MACGSCFILYCFNFSTILPIEGFKLGSEKHTTEVILKKSGVLQLTSGVEGLALLKTTKVSSFLFHNSDKQNQLPDVLHILLLLDKARKPPSFLEFKLLSIKYTKTNLFYRSIYCLCYIYFIF